jgi:reactive intermediate/imine deaminase
MRRYRLAVLAALVLLACGTPLAAQQQQQQGQRRQPQQTQQPPRPEFVAGDPALPFSQAVRVGNTIYLSGMIGTEGSGLVPGGIQPETRRTLENIRSTLERLGGTMDDVVKCTVFLADIKEWAAMNEAYVTFFPKNKPARSALGTSGLAMNARVEIECLAVTDGR